MKTIESGAFRLAAMRSERYRIFGILCVLTAMILLNIVLALLDMEAANVARRAQYSLFWIFCGACELPMLFMARRRERAGNTLAPIAPWMLILQTLFESSLPTIGLLGLSLDKTYLGPYLAIFSPALLIYCFFIILSTLRLSPALCILSGATSAGGYVFVYLLMRRLAPNNVNQFVMPHEVYVVTPILLFCAGLIAAAVAREIRNHVIAALAEAEKQRKLDLMERDLNIARSIQMGLLPKRPPAISGYDVAGFSRPADQTGGDYYDWMELPERQVLFTIADAAGHGIGPALLVTACRAYFRALANHLDPLERITAQVDLLIAADVPGDRFITAAIALLNPAAHRLNLYSAGHAPLFYYDSAKDCVVTFDADQPPLGVRFGSDGSVARVLEMAPGDALVLVTDGFFECGNAAGELLGSERLGEVIREHHGEGAEEMIRRLTEVVTAFSGAGPQADDLTAVVIKRSGLGGN